MITIGLLSIFLSVYCLYAISEKVEYSKDKSMLFLMKNAALTKGLIVGLFFLALWQLSFRLGLVNGTLAATVLWMAFASVFLLFAPFKKINLFAVAALASCSIILEVLA